MLLEIDMGNSRLKWRLKCDGLIVGNGCFAMGSISEIQDQIPLLGVEQVAIASVNSLENLQVLRGGLLGLGLDVDIYIAKTEAKSHGVTCGYVEPYCLGIDRWLAVLEAYRLCGGSCCVVDMGTAITVDWVDGMGNHIGGLIAPGESFMQASLLKGTEQVNFSPEVCESYSLSGNGTAECVSAGVGMMSRAFIDYVVGEHPLSKGCEFYFTGGGASNIVNSLVVQVEYIPDLVLDGLCLVSGDYFMGKN